jgi:hypothetical protein
VLILLVLGFVTLQAIVVFVGCDDSIYNDSTIKGNENYVNQERTVTGFDSIVAYGAGDINIYPAEYYKVLITTDSNIQDIIGIEVENNILHIEYGNKGKGYSTKCLTIDVYMPVLNAAALRGSGDININNENISDLVINLSGSGDINAHNNPVQRASVTLSGSGTIRVWANNTLTGTLSGSGNILYKGTPSININKSGSGSVKPM